MRVITDMLSYCTTNMPNYNTISVSGYHIREAGSTAAQELAFTLANGFTYVEYGIEAGLNVDAFAPRLSFFFNSHLDFFEEIAKYRAARRIWAKRMKNKYGAKNERSMALRFHAQTAGCSLTAQQPEINIARTGFQAMAAVLGGTQSLHTNSMGGSWFVESLTDSIEEQVEQYFKIIDELGGVIPAIEQGYLQHEIANAASDYQNKVDNNQRIVVSVNDFVNEEEEIDIPILEINTQVERAQCAKLDLLRKNRNNSEVRSALNQIKIACKNNENLVPLIIVAAKAYATLGEIVVTMKDELGEWQETAVF